VLHIATHGMFRRANPMLSALRLGDGWVSYHDLESMRVRGELVVLSTCESGVAGVSAGSEILGLARGFLHAGARALLCSQWRVRDDVTLAFMRAFYGSLRDGHDAAAAHRHAMATVRGDHPHPYFWAPFFLMGAPTAGRATPCPSTDRNF
jgi:CHAT domain-containing protein